MERILRAEAGWQEEVARALRTASRPIATDSRFTPRPPTGDVGRQAPWGERSGVSPARKAATLLLLYPGENGELTVPLTVRHAELRSHAGEVSLPGGAVDASDATREAAALREAHEEIGVEPEAVRILGSLDEIWIPVSNYELRPYVGATPARPRILPHSAEVAAVVELPVRRLLAPDAVTQEVIEIRGWSGSVAVYRHAGERIWGATARTLAMFAAVLHHARGADPPA